jgi:trans-aconitate 2-methyltransferase
MHRLAPMPGQRILDLGCGDGRLTTTVLEAIGMGHVVGIDRSEALLREAVGRTQSRPPITPLHDASTEPSRLSYVQGDGAALPFADAFDAVISAAALHWMQDHDAVFASVYRTLAPGGRFVAECGGAGNLRALLDRAAEHLRRAPFARHAAGWREPWQFPDVPTTLMRLERAGFTAIDVSLEPSPRELPGAAAYAEFVAQSGLRPHLEPLPETLRQTFVEAITAQAAADPEPFVLDYWRLNIAASKPAAAEQAA